MKSLKKYRIFLERKFESKGFYMSYKWMKPKKKKKKEIVYLTSEWYIIPEPSPDAFDKEIKPKYIFFNKNQDLLYKKYDVILDQYFRDAAFIFYHKNVYTLGILKNFTKFPFSIKFDFLWTMSHLLSFYNFSSFGLFYVKLYFSEKNFKLINKLVFKEFFTIFVNHNKPFVWRKGKKYVGKQKGTAYVLIWRAIYRQIFYEAIGEPFKFNLDEKKFFQLAEIDPNDPKYYWPTWRLNLIGLSTHSGKISNRFLFEKKTIIDKFEHFKLIIEKNFWFKILKQIFFWRELLLDLLINNWIYFDLENFLSNDLNKKFNNFLPVAFFGWKNTFFSENFIFLEETKIPIWLEKIIFKSENYSIYKLLSFHSSIPHFDSFLDKKISFNKFIKIKNKLNVLSNKKLLQKNIVEEFEFVKQLYFDWINLQDLTVNFFENFRTDNDQPKLYSLPNFLSFLFFIFTDKFVDSEVLENYIIRPLLNSLDTFKKILKKPYIYNNLYNKNLNLFFTPFFKKLTDWKHPALIHKFVHANLSAFFKTDFNLNLEKYLSELKYFNTIYLSEIYKEKAINLNLSEAMTPTSLLTLQLSYFSKNKNEAIKLKTKYNIIIIFNLFFYFYKSRRKNKLTLFEKWFLYSFLFINKKNKKLYKNHFFNITEIVRWYASRFKINIFKPKEFQHFENSSDYANWFENFFDPNIEQTLGSEKIFDLNYCLPKLIVLNIENFFLKKKNYLPENIALQQKNITQIWVLYLKKLQKRLYKNFLVWLLSPRFWMTIFYKNINLTKIAKTTFITFNFFWNSILNYFNTTFYKYSYLTFDKFWVFLFIKNYFLIKNIIINQKNFLYLRLKKKKWKILV